MVRRETPSLVLQSIFKIFCQTDESLSKIRIRNENTIIEKNTTIDLDLGNLVEIQNQMSYKKPSYFPLYWLLNRGPYRFIIIPT